MIAVVFLFRRNLLASTIDSFGMKKSAVNKPRFLLGYYKFGTGFLKYRFDLRFQLIFYLFKPFVSKYT